MSSSLSVEVIVTEADSPVSPTRRSRSRTPPGRNMLGVGVASAPDTSPRHGSGRSLHYLQQHVKKHKHRVLRLPSGGAHDGSGSVRLDSPLAGTYRPLTQPTSPSHILNSVHRSASAWEAPRSPVERSDGEDTPFESADNDDRREKRKAKRSRSKDRNQQQQIKSPSGHGRRRSWGGWRLRIGQKTSQAGQSFEQAAVSEVFTTVGQSSPATSPLPGDSAHFPTGRKGHWQRWKRPELAALAANSSYSTEDEVTDSLNSSANGTCSTPASGPSQIGVPGEEYSGNIRFYFLSNGQEVAKVVRLTSNTTTTELVPILVEKFHAYINADMRYPELFNVVMKLGGERGEERHLRGNDRPLHLTLQNGVPPRFMLQQSEARRLVKTIGMFSSTQNSRDSLNSIGSGISAGERSLQMGSPAFNASQASRSQSSLNDSDSCSEAGVADVHSPTSPLPPHGRSPRKSFLKSFRNNVLRDKKKTGGNRPSSPRKKGPAPRVTRQESRRDSVDSMGNMVRIFSGPSLLEQFNSDYKSVVITEITTAHQTIHSALQRYHLEGEDPSDFILCDTVGRLEAYSRQTGQSIDRISQVEDADADIAYRFIVHYSRLVNPNEHPLLLQQNWQPVLDCEQRFVLHPRRSVPAFRPTSPTPSTPSLSSRTNSLDALSYDGTEDEEAIRLTFTQHHSAKTGRVTFRGILTNRVPVPFLITLTCTREEDSLLMYPLTDKVTTIGRWSSSRFSADSAVCIPLCSDDLEPVHCQVRCTEYSKGGEAHRSYSLETVNDAPVYINGEALASSMKKLHNGDLLQIGQHHAFVFRDPNATAESRGNGSWTWLPKLSQAKDINGTSDVAENTAVTSSSSSNVVRRHEEGEEADLEYPDEERHHPDGCETPDAAVSQSPNRDIERQYDSTAQLEAINKPTSHKDSDTTPRSSHSSRPSGLDDTVLQTDESAANVSQGGVSPATSKSSRPGSASSSKHLNVDTGAGPGLETKVAASGDQVQHSQPHTPATQVTESVAGNNIPGERRLRFRFSNTSLLGQSTEVIETLDDRFCFNLTTEKQEEKFLSIVLTSMTLQSVETPLAPAFAVCLALQQLHKATESEKNSRRVSRFVNKLAEGVQEVVWQSASKLEAHKETFTAEGDPLETLQPVLPALHELVMWLANSLEILHAVHQLLRLRGEEVGKLSSGPPSSLPGHGMETLESLSLLQEVVVFAFQQILYPVTKLLYVLLPSVLDENPFDIADQRQKMAKSLTRQGYLAMSQVDRLTELLRTMMDALYTSQLHPNISYQLLSNLLFFTNASLFNTLMEDVEFYCWSKGMEIRANLDRLEKWTADQPAEVREALRHLVQLSLAAELLSLAPEQLLSSTWSGLRNEFAGIDPAQMNRLLQNYKLPEGTTRPAEWEPTPDDARQARSEKNVLISFASHPPLRIPNTKYTLSLMCLPSNDDVVNYLQAVQERMAEAGFQMGATSPQGKRSQVTGTPVAAGPHSERAPPIGGDSPEISRNRLATPKHTATGGDGGKSQSAAVSASSSSGSLATSASSRTSSVSSVESGSVKGVGSDGDSSSHGDQGLLSPMSQSSEYLSYSLGSLEAIEEADEPMTGQNTPAISRKTSEQPLLPPTTTSSSTVSPLVNHAGLRHSSSSSSLGSLEKTPRGSIILPGGVKVDAASAPRRPSITDIPKLIPSPKVTRAQLVYTSDAGASSDSEAEERHDSHLRPSTVSIPTMSKSPSGISITVETPDDEAFDSSLSHSSLMPVIQADVPKVPFDAMQDAVLAEEEGIEHARLKPLSLSHYSASVQSLHDHGVDDLMMRANCLLDDDAGSSGSDDQLNETMRPDGRTSFASPLTTPLPLTNSSGSSYGTQKNNDDVGDVVTVTLRKSDGGLGLGVVDGKLLGVNPGVYISSMVPGLAAQKCGQLQPGDKILAINGANLMEATQNEAYRILKSGGPQITIVAVRDEQVQQMVSASSC